MMTRPDGVVPAALCLSPLSSPLRNSQAELILPLAPRPRAGWAHAGTTCDNQIRALLLCCRCYQTGARRPAATGAVACAGSRCS